MIMSELDQTSAAEPTISAPARSYRCCGMLDPEPAPSWINTWWPAAVSSRAPSGVRATRYSLSLTSLGTPTITVRHPLDPGCGKRTRPFAPPEEASGGVDGEQLPAAGDAPEGVLAAIGQHDAGTGHQVGHRPRDQDLARTGEPRDAGADVDRDPPEVAVGDLDLARVHAGPDLDTEPPDGLDRGGGASDRPRRPVEGREEPVARVVHLT